MTQDKSMSQSNDVQQQIIDALQTLYENRLIVDSDGHIRPPNSEEMVMSRSELETMADLLEQSNREAVDNAIHLVDCEIDSIYSGNKLNLNDRYVVHRTCQNIKERLAELQHPEGREE